MAAPGLEQLTTRDSSIHCTTPWLPAVVKRPHGDCHNRDHCSPFASRVPWENSLWVCDHNVLHLGHPAFTGTNRNHVISRVDYGRQIEHDIETKFPPIRIRRRRGVHHRAAARTGARAHPSEREAEHRRRRRGRPGCGGHQRGGSGHRHEDHRPVRRGPANGPSQCADLLHNIRTPRCTRIFARCSTRWTSRSTR